MTRSRIAVYLVLLTFPLLSQCATVFKAPPEESDAAKSFDVPDDRGVVFLYRLGRAVGAASATQITVNGIAAGGTGPGTFFRWELKPGKYTFLASTGESSATVALDVEAGKIYFVEQNVRLGVNDARVTLKVQEEDAGRRAVESSRLTVSAYIPE